MFTMSKVYSAKFDVVKVDGTGNFDLWQMRVKNLLVQHGMMKALYGKKLESMGDLD